MMTLRDTLLSSWMAFAPEGPAGGEPPAPVVVDTNTAGARDPGLSLPDEDSADFAAKFMPPDEEVDEPPAGGATTDKAVIPAQITPATSPPPPPPPAAPKPAEATPPPAPPAAAEPAKPKEGEAATPPAPAQTGEKPADGTQQGATPKSLVDLINENADKVVETLAQTSLKLTDKEREAIERGDADVHSTLAARTYIEVMKAVATLIQNQIPLMALAAVQAHTTVKTEEDEFFSANQDLKPHRDELQQTAKILSGLKPQASRQDILTEAMRTVRAMHGLPLTPPTNGAANGANGSTPSGVTKTEVPTAFTPASGTVPARVPGPTEKGKWERFAELLDSDTE